MKEQLNRIWERIRPILREIVWFLTSSTFLKNFGGIIGVFGFIIILSFWWLKCYTNHGNSLQVHNYERMALEDAIKLAKSRSFQIIINDSSVYDKEIGPHIVTEQSPKPFSRVKKNRSIYLTITKKEPPMRSLPKLTGGNDDFNRFRSKCEHHNIKVEVKREVFSVDYESNTILRVFYEGEEITRKINKNFEVPEGSTVEVVVTTRTSSSVNLPSLVCKKYDAAKFMLGSYNLLVGNVVEDVSVTDRFSAYVYKQVPAYEPGKIIGKGEQIDLYLTQSLPSQCGETDPVLEDNSEIRDNSTNF